MRSERKKRLQIMLIGLKMRLAEAYALKEHKNVLDELVESIDELQEKLK